MSRGRGRGGGAATSLNREQLAALGHVPGETTSVLISEPPPLYPPLNRKPVPLPESLDLDYLLILRQDFLDHMQTSGAYLQMPQEIKNKPQQQIDKLVAQLPNIREKYDWELFPAELRPKVVGTRTKVKQVKSIDIATRLDQLEQIEDKTNDREVAVKDEVEQEEIDEEIIENYEDEDIDDGTDYANNYFDNGEEFEDDDDNLDDGPIY